MIDTESGGVFGITRIDCDADGCTAEFTHDGFDGHCDIATACKEAKEEGWIIKKIDGDWWHYCSEECFKKDNGGGDGCSTSY